VVDVPVMLVHEQTGVRVGTGTSSPVVHGVVVKFDHDVVTVELGDQAEEWVFPRSMLPADIGIDSVLTFAGSGDAELIDHRPAAPSVEDRLSRSLNRRRLKLG